MYLAQAAVEAIRQLLFLSMGVCEKICKNISNYWGRKEGFFQLNVVYKIYGKQAILPYFCFFISVFFMQILSSICRKTGFHGE